MSFIQEIEQLAELKDRGILTEDEFAQKKAEMLAGRPPADLPAGSERPAKTALDVSEKLLIEQRLANEKPSVMVAYVLWFFTGLIGGHRFYLGRKGSAITMLLLSMTIAGLLVTMPWSLIDLFLIPDIVRQKTDEVRDRLTLRAL